MIEVCTFASRYQALNHLLLGSDTEKFITFLFYLRNERMIANWTDELWFSEQHHKDINLYTSILKSFEICRELYANAAGTEDPLNVAAAGYQSVVSSA